MGLDFLGVENTYGLLLVHYLPSRMFFSELVPAILVVQQKQQQNESKKGGGANQLPFV